MLRLLGHQSDRPTRCPHHDQTDSDLSDIPTARVANYRACSGLQRLTDRLTDWNCFRSALQGPTLWPKPKLSARLNPPNIHLLARLGMHVVWPF